MGALEKKGLLYSVGIRGVSIVTRPTNLLDVFTMVFGIRFIVLLILSFIILFFPFLECRIHNLNLIPKLQAQEIRTQPAEKELKRADEILRRFQKPRERESKKFIKEFQKPDEEKAKELYANDTESQTSNPEHRDTEYGRLFYFFSFSMPRESLKTILPEAEKTGAVMVLRGMKEDTGLRATVMKIADLLKRREKESYQVEVWIHPTLFTCFDVDSVPQIVYVTGTQDEEGCSDNYIKVRGDVSIEYALELIAKEDKSAKNYLKLLKDNFWEWGSDQRGRLGNNYEKN